MASMQFLSKEQLDLVKYAIEGKGLSSEILARSNKGTDTVKPCSMQTLRPGTWFNDVVINYYIKICLAKRDQKICDGDSKGRKQSHFFISYFAQNIFDEKAIKMEKRVK
jgi:Ulp1 family protease